MKKFFSLFFIFLSLLIFTSPALVSADIVKQGQVFIQAIVGHITPSPQETGGSRPPLIFDFTPPRISSIKIKNITRTSAEISWQTDEETVFQLNYGKTNKYGEILAGKDFEKDFQIALHSLSPSTLYHFEIIAKDKAGNSFSSGDYVFQTPPSSDVIPPANVSSFTAKVGDKKIVLTWENPSDKDFLGVRITRSEKFFPVSPSEGTLIYQGSGEKVIDASLANGVTYYYTAFSFDKSGNFASGAITFGTPKSSVAPSLPQPPQPPMPPFPSAPPVPEIEKISLEDFDFYQAGQKIPLIGGEKLKIKPEEPLRISINYEKMPEVLKTIVVSLGKEGKFFSFLLRVNPPKTAYNAVLLAPKEAGVYSLTLAVLDYKNQALKKIQGQLVVEEQKEVPRSQPLRKEKLLIALNIFLVILILLLISLIILEKKK